MLNEDDERKQIRLDSAEAEMAQTTDYQTCSQYGEKQAQLKAPEDKLLKKLVDDMHQE